MCNDDGGGVVCVCLLCNFGPLDDFGDKVYVGNMSVAVARGVLSCER